MTDKEKTFCEVWEKKREQGKLKYIIISGIVVHAALAVVLISILQMVMEKNFSISVLITPEGIKSTLSFTAVLAVAGAIVSLTKWDKNQKIYNNLKYQIRPKAKKRKSI